MITALLGLQESPAAAASSHEESKAASRRRSARWISALGWMITLSGGLCMMIGLSDLQNLVVLAAIGLAAMPFGLLIIANGKILSGLAAIEKNTQATAEPSPAKRPNK